MKRIVVCVLFSLSLTQAASAATWNKSVAAAQQQAKQKNQFIFVDLFAEWCGWCHKMEREVFPSEKFQQATKDLVLLRVNTEDKAEGSKMSRDFKVTSLPTFLLLTPELKLAGVIRGYAPSAEFSARIGEMRKEYEVFTKKVQMAAAQPKDHKLGLEVASEMNAREAFAEAERKLTRLIIEKGLTVDLRDQAYYQLAVSQFNQQKFDDSMRTLQKFATVQSKGEVFERSRLLVGDIFLQQGKYKSALAEFRNFKRQYPSSPLAKNVDSIMPQLEKVAAASN